MNKAGSQKKARLVKYTDIECYSLRIASRALIFTARFAG